MVRHLALAVATLAVALPVGLTTATPASAASFPKEAKRAYTKTCVKSARESGLRRNQARRYCRVALRCLERTMTVREFTEYGQAVARGDDKPPHRRKVNRCIREAAEAVS